MPAAAALRLLPRELDDSRLDELLHLWERWMSPGAKNVMELGFPNTAAGCVGGGYSTSFDDMVDEADSRSAEAVNAAIDSLEPIQAMAVYHKHLYAVFKFNRADLDTIYNIARDILRVVLPTKGIY